MWEDSTNVSVQALRTFLINFTKNSDDVTGIPTISSEKPAVQSRPHESRRPTNSHNAKAVRAYQAMAEQNQDRAYSDNDKPDLTDIEKIESKEVRDIYQLIADLDALEKKGLQEIRIERAESFVESLKNAVQLEKLKF